MINETKIPPENLTEWLEGIASGNERSFKKLFDAFSESLTVFAFSLTRNRQAALEIVDEVFVRVWKNRAQATGIANIKTYLYTAIKNTALNHLSKKSYEQITDPFDFLDIELQKSESPEQSLISAEILDKIHDAVEALPPRCKMIFKLVREDGLKYQEVADVLNLSTKTVDAQMVIAVKKISEQVKPMFERMPSAPKKR